MSFSAKNETNPLVISATGYAPYHEQRLERAKTCHDVDSKTRRRDEANKEYWIRERAYQDISDYVQHHDTEILRSKWECAADKKSMYSLVKWQMDKIKDRDKEHLLERRKRLKELFEYENNMYNNEEKFEMPSPEIKKEEMLKRYTDIMVDKELERQKVAKSKVDLQLRRNCDELRSIISKKICKLTVEEGKILNENKLREEEEAKNLEDRMYAEAWIKDSEAKERKDAEEIALKKQRNTEFSKCLIDQMMNHKPKAESADAFNENQLLMEQKRLMELEKDWKKSQKIMNQERYKKQLDKCLKDKLRRKAKEVQEDLMLDLYFLEKVTDTKAEKKMAKEKKQILHKEQQAYLNFLSEQLKKEMEFEKQLEKMQQQANDQMWERKEKEWEADRQRKEELNKKAMRECHEQILNKMEKSRQVQERRIQYGEEIRKQSEIDQKRLEEEVLKVKERNMKYREELVKQIMERKEEAKQQKEEKQKEWEKFKLVEEEYDRKVKELSANVQLDNLHPGRKKF